MKKSLLLLFVCLFGALGGVKAWTSVKPYVGRSYYLLNANYERYWYSKKDDAFHITDDLSKANRVTFESASGSNYAFAYYLNDTKYYLHEDAGNAKWPTSSSTMEVGATNYGYYVRNNKDGSKHRYMNAHSDEGVSFGKVEDNSVTNDKYRSWQFISVYELDSNTPDVCRDAAEASCLSAANGWERVRDNATLDASLSDYFFAIVCANYPGLMVNMANGNASQQAGDKFSSSKSMWYSNSANPEVDNSFLWMIEPNTTPNYEGYTFRNASYPSLTIQTEWNTGGWGMSWYAHTNDQANPCQWNSYALIPSNGVYTIKTLANGGDNYLGLWTPSNDYINGQELAGNKGTAEQGKFLIYRKLKKDVNMTSLITNPSFETGALTPWSAESRNDTGVKDQSNGTYSITQGDPVDGQKLFNSWGGTGENSVSQTISLSKGTYRLSALLAGFTGETLTLSAGGQSSNVVVAGDKTYGYTVSVKFTLTETSNVTIKASNTKSQQTSDASFIKADNFRLTYLGVMATDDDYTALQTAINNADAKVLGFDDGEYAPYNNVAVLKALADAKAIDKNVDNLQMDVQDATAAIANENWTVNSGEVNAIYNPTFALSDNDGAMAGWENSNTEAGLGGATHSRAFVLHSGDGNYSHLAPFNQGDDVRSAAYLRFDSYNSGKDAVYTYGGTSDYPMPLKSSTYYNVKFDMGSWNQPNKDIKLTVVDGAGNEVDSQTKSTIGSFHDDSGTLVSFDLVFLAEEAGNYKIKISNPNDVDNAIVVSNFELKRYNGMIEDDDTNTQVYYGTFKSRVDLTPTEEHPFVDITHASFDGEVFVNLYDNPNGLLYATPSQVNSIKSSYGTTEAIPNVVSNDGNVCESLVIYDGHPFFVPSHSNIRATEATYSRTIASTSNYGTICLPYAVESDKNIQYYTIGQIDGNVLKLNEVASVEAGAPAIFKKKDGGATEITVAANDVSIASDAGTNGSSVVLKGTFERITIGTDGATGSGAANGKYYINSSNQFCEGKDWFYVGAFRAYLEAAGYNARLSISVDDEATAINELKTLDEKQGLQDGKYLIDGKIIVVKAGKQYNVNGVIK